MRVAICTAIGYCCMTSNERQTRRHQLTIRRWTVSTYRDAFPAGIMVPVCTRQQGWLPVLTMPDCADGFTEFAGYSRRYQVMALGDVKRGGQPIDERQRQNDETPEMSAELRLPDACS